MISISNQTLYLDKNDKIIRPQQLVAQHVAAIDAGEKPMPFDPPTPSPPQVQKVYEEVPVTSESSGSDQELTTQLPPPQNYTDECLGLQAMMIKPQVEKQKIEIVKGLIYDVFYLVFHFVIACRSE